MEMTRLWAYLIAFAASIGSFFLLLARVRREAVNEERAVRASANAELEREALERRIEIDENIQALDDDSVVDELRKYTRKDGDSL